MVISYLVIGTTEASKWKSGNWISSVFRHVVLKVFFLFRDSLDTFSSKVGGF